MVYRGILTIALISLLSSLESKSEAAEYSYSFDCICESEQGYINAYMFQKPFRLPQFAPGDTIAASASGCVHLEVCPVRALSGSLRFSWIGWNENTANIYKFMMYGPRRQ